MLANSTTPEDAAAMWNERPEEKSEEISETP
jgi:hypothetical protein